MTDIRIDGGTRIKAGTITADRVDLTDDFNFTGNLQISGAAVATQAYADALKAGLTVKAEVAAATTVADGNLGLSGLADTVDGVAIDTAGMRVLVKNQTDPAENGIYVAAALTWSRASDFDADADVTAGALVPVAPAGTDNGSLFFLLLTDNPAVGTDDLSFAQFPADAVSPPVAGVDGDISTITPDAAADAGVSADFAPADHVHAIDCAAPSGNITETGSASEGSASSFLRSDAVFALPDLGREGASTLLANIQRRGFELYTTPGTNGTVANLGYSTKCAVVPNVNMTVSILGGIVYGSGGVRRQTIGATVTHDAADTTDPRIDVVVFPESGIPTIRKGTAGAIPAIPTLTPGDTALAYVYIAANDTSIGSGDIYDARRWSNPVPTTAEFAGDASTVDFDLPKRIAAGSDPAVFIDGLRMVKKSSPSTASEYKVSDVAQANGSRVTFGAAPAADAVIVVDYLA